MAMDKQAEKRVRQWIRNWEAAAPVLQRLRDEAIRNADTAAAIEQLSDAYESARRHWKPAPHRASSTNNAGLRGFANEERCPSFAWRRTHFASSIRLPRETA